MLKVSNMFMLSKSSVFEIDADAICPSIGCTHYLVTFNSSLGSSSTGLCSNLIGSKTNLNITN